PSREPVEEGEMRPRPGGHREGRLLGTREPHLRPEDVVPPEHHATEQLLVDEAHRLGRRERRPVLLGEQEPGAPVVLARPRALERHDAAESVGTVAREHVVLPASETPEVLARQVDAAAPPVLGDIAQDVRELEGEPEMHRVLASRRILVAEDPDRDEPDGPRHAPAVLREVAVPRLVAVTPEVRLDTRDDRLEVLALDREVLGRVRQRDADPMARP